MNHLIWKILALSCLPKHVSWHLKGRIDLWFKKTRRSQWRCWRRTLRLKSDLCYFNLKIVQKFIYVLCWLCYFFWKTFAAFNCMYSWPICFVVLKLLLFWKHSLQVSVYLIMNYISYCSTWIPNYFCSENLLA